MSSKNIYENLAAHVAIQDAVARYTTAVNQRDFASLRELFTHDAEWNVAAPNGETFVLKGQDIPDRLPGMMQGLELLVQTVHSPVIEVRGDTATAVSTIHETSRSKDHGFNVMMGTYYDDLVRDEDGEWRFRKRVFRPTYFDLSPPPGTVVARFPLAERPQ